MFLIIFFYKKLFCFCYCDFLLLLKNESMASLFCCASGWTYVLSVVLIFE